MPMAEPSTSEPRATTRVRALAATDRESWSALWQGYIAFYKAVVPDAVTEETWRRLLDPAAPMFCLVAEHGKGEVIGLVNCVLHLNTWTARRVCYLEDLFVAPAARGRGAARALIEAVAERMRIENWHRVYWMTKTDNAAARALYDKIAPVTDWVRYDIPGRPEG